VILISALVVAAAIVWAGLQIAGELRAARAGSGTNDRVAALLGLFARALTETRNDPGAFLVWQPIAKAARQLFPGEFASLDRATGGRFPFPAERIGPHRWTADWLARDSPRHR
jgi:hypothetical protein